MRLARLFTISLLSFTALAAKAPNYSLYDTYFPRHASSAPLEIDEQAYNELTSTPRDYNLAVLLTARPARYACQICREFDPEWKIIGSSWAKGDKKGESRVLLTTLDFDHGRNVFIKLQLQTAPILLLFPPTTGPSASTSSQPQRFEFLGHQSAESIHAWLTRHLPQDRSYPPLVRPINYTRILFTLTTLTGLFTFGTVAYPYILPVVQNRNLWAAISLILVLLFTSGHMYNHIRKVPYVTGDGKGGITYFAGGFQNQYGMETQIVAAMYAILSFATISLALKIPRISDPRTQQIAVVIWGSVVFGMYSFLISVFRIKNGGYPFWLPPF